MLKKLVPGIVAAALVFCAAGCATGDVPQSKFQTGLEKEAYFTKAEASCVSQKVYAKLPQSDINKLYTSPLQTDLSSSLQESFSNILHACNLKS